ncbi:Chaperone DnaJ 2 [Gossypium arboreum]|uniref:Chaperone DnaJ 2 n=2 Tax=Gossypium TaxID=3633 RepID=A0A0B0PTQ8_GOSAR|nr:Chaperone DnaJ 2 [Gossypium arboreum]
MQGDEARLLLSFPSNRCPTQIEVAYRKKVWELHLDLFPVQQKPLAESKFKLVNEKEQLEHVGDRRHRKPDTKEISTFYMHSDNEDEGGEEEGYLQCVSKDILAIDDKVSDNDIRNNVRGRSPGSSGNGAEPLLKKSRLDSVFLKSLKSQTSAHYKQPRARTGFEKKTHREVISAICKFFYHAGIPSNAANSPYFHKMLELVGQYGQGLQAIHGDDVRKYGPFWSVIESNWSSLFHHPLYVAAYFLNPSYRYRPDFLMNPEVFRGLNECIVRLEADNGKKIAASMQIPDFVSAKADFGTDLAISTRSELDPESVLDDWLVETEKLAMHEDEEIIYTEVEQFCGDDMDEHESEEKRPAEMVTIAGFIEPLDVIPSAGGVTTDDDGLDFLDDDLTD